MANKFGGVWVKTYPGIGNLTQTKAQVEKFATKLGAANQVFLVGDQGAQAKYFEKTNDTDGQAGVEGASLVFFSGHGETAGKGPLFSDGNVATPPEDAWGNKSVSPTLRWMVFDACWTLTSPTTNPAITRWAGAFKGLRYIFGFRKTCGDENTRGAAFADNLLAGKPFRQAWSLAAEAAQDGASWAYLRASPTSKAVTGTYNDKWTTTSSLGTAAVAFRYVYRDGPADSSTGAP